jgi:quinol monooxygenase YgiN
MAQEATLDPVIVIARAVPLPGRGPEVIDILSDLIPRVHEEPGCILYTLNEADNGDLVFIEKWATQADADVHGTTSPILAVLAEKVSPLVVGVPHIETHRAVPFGDPAKGAL